MAAKTLQGVVTSEKMNKTVTVMVGRELNIQSTANILVYQPNTMFMMKKKYAMKATQF